MAAFRHCYGKLYELRSLAPNTPMVALTATATKLTEDTIKKVLLMQNPLDIKESPNKVNLTYNVFQTKMRFSKLESNLGLPITT